jgi:16S rRNA (guanine(966)-N(2))-methyltransferase RsmD
MRVIAGRYRSRPLAAPAGLATRPTTDRLRETLFNVLCHGAVNAVAGNAVLDLYAGSGAVGIEALSRDASRAVFVESDVTALTVLKKNLDSLGIRAGIAVERRGVAAFLRREAARPQPQRFGLVFLDPPWDLADEYSLTLGLLGDACTGLLQPDALVVAEHRRKASVDASYGSLTRTRVLEQGDAGLSFYRVAQSD